MQEIDNLRMLKNVMGLNDTKNLYYSVSRITT